MLVSLLTSGDPPASASQSDGITGMALICFLNECLSLPVDCKLDEGRDHTCFCALFDSQGEGHYLAHNSSSIQIYFFEMGS